MSSSGAAASPTGIGKRVEQAIVAVTAGDGESALIPASIAVDATAHKEFPNESNNKAYKLFLKRFMPLISALAFGTKVNGLYFRYSHRNLKADSSGQSSLEAVLYHVIRCGLVHEASLPSDVTVRGHALGLHLPGLQLPESMALGLVGAVIAAPMNAAERTSEGVLLKIPYFRPVEVNELWGKTDFMNWLVGEHAPAKPDGATIDRLLIGALQHVYNGHRLEILAGPDSCSRIALLDGSTSVAAIAAMIPSNRGPNQFVREAEDVIQKGRAAKLYSDAIVVAIAPDPFMFSLVVDRLATYRKLGTRVVSAMIENSSVEKDRRMWFGA